MIRRHKFGRVSGVLISIVVIGGCADGDGSGQGNAERSASVEATSASIAASTATLLPASTEGGPDEFGGALPFLDAFDDDSNGWGGPFQRFEDGDYVWELPSGQSDKRSPDTLIAVEDDLDATEITTSFDVEGIDAVGVECAFEEINGSSRWYRLVLDVDGAEILEQPVGMVGARSLASNTATRLADGAYVVTVVCRPGADGYRLELSVDGDLVVAATDTDDPFGRAGAPNLYVQARPSGGAAAHTARFHEISIVDPGQQE